MFSEKPHPISSFMTLWSNVTNLLQTGLSELYMETESHGDHPSDISILIDFENTRPILVDIYEIVKKNQT